MSDEIIINIQKKVNNNFDLGRLDTNLVSPETLLNKPYFFVRGVCSGIKGISVERVDEIVMNTLAPENSRGRTKSIEIRGLAETEVRQIKNELDKLNGGIKELILSIRQKESSVIVTLRPEIGYLGDALLLKPWEFVRSIAELAEIESERITSVVMGTIAPKDQRGLTKNIQIKGLSEQDLESMARILYEITPELEARQVFFTLAINVDDDRKPRDIEIKDINAEPEVFFVENGQFVISTAEVQTAGLDMCTGLGIRFADGRNFLAHINATTDTQKMRNAIRALIEGGIEIVDYKVWVGLGLTGVQGAEISKKKAGEVLNDFAFNDENKYSMVQYMDRVGINKNGFFYP